MKVVGHVLDRAFGMLFARACVIHTNGMHYGSHGKGIHTEELIKTSYMHT